MPLLKKVKTFVLKSTTMIGVCCACVAAPLTFPVFAVVALATRSPAYLTIPFIILDLKTILTFIYNS
jgi:hypothetical protein